MTRSCWGLNSYARIRFRHRRAIFLVFKHRATDLKFLILIPRLQYSRTTGPALNHKDSYTTCILLPLESQNRNIDGVSSIHPFPSRHFLTAISASLPLLHENDPKGNSITYPRTTLQWPIHT